MESEPSLTIESKLRSRKLWVTLLVAVLILFGQMLGLEFDVERVWAAAAVASSYLFGQSYVDRGLAPRSRA